MSVSVCICREPAPATGRPGALFRAQYYGPNGARRRFPYLHLLFSNARPYPSARMRKRLPFLLVVLLLSACGKLAEVPTDPGGGGEPVDPTATFTRDRKSTRLNSSHRTYSRMPP